MTANDRSALRLTDQTHALFALPKGRAVYHAAEQMLAADGWKMAGMLQEGTLVGFSGGADSSMLLLFLSEYRRKHSLDFPLLAVHIHHGIRGEEADRDAEFACSFCHSLGIEFLLIRKDVPALSRAEKIGLEEAARKVRYSCFEDILQGRNDLHTIALAHNSDDSLETVLFRLVRGAGTDGLCGILPVRGRIVRPLLSATAKEIRDALDEAEIPYVRDSSNSDERYARNLIRSQVVPALIKAHPGAELAAQRSARHLQTDRDYLEGVASDFLSAYPDGIIPRAELCALHPAIFFRVIKQLCAHNGCLPDEKAIERVRSALSLQPPQAVSLPGNQTFFCSENGCRLLAGPFREKQDMPLMISLPFGQNKDCDVWTLSEFGAMIAFSDPAHTQGLLAKIPQNVYKIAIQADLSSAIIQGDLRIRSRKEGDAYRYKSMTHRVKKMMNDKAIPPTERDSIPVFCDDRGIVWIPGFGVRDDGGGDPFTISIFLRKGAMSDLATHALRAQGNYRGIVLRRDLS